MNKAIGIENGDQGGKGGNNGNGGEGKGGARGKRSGGKGRRFAGLRWLGEEWVLQVGLVGAVLAALADGVARINGSTII